MRKRTKTTKKKQEISQLRMDWGVFTSLQNVELEL